MCRACGRERSLPVLADEENRSGFVRNRSTSELREDQTPVDDVDYNETCDLPTWLMR